MAELSSVNEDKNVSTTGGFKLFGKSPSRNFSPKKTSSNPLKRIFSKKSDKQRVYEGERDESISNEAEIEVMEEDAPSIILEKIEKVVPQDIEEKTSKILEEAAEVVPNLIQEVIQETKKEDSLVVESNEGTPTSEDSISATEDKKPESLVDKLKEEREKINEELHEKAKKSGLEGLYKTIIEQPETVPSDDQPLDDQPIQERSVNIDEVKGDNQENDKEDNCVTSLAQGLQQICAPWNSKKED